MFLLVFFFFFGGGDRIACFSFSFLRVFFWGDRIGGWQNGTLLHRGMKRERKMNRTQVESVAHRTQTYKVITFWDRD